MGTLFGKGLDNADAANIIFDTGIIIRYITKHPFESPCHFTAEING